MATATVKRTSSEITKQKEPLVAPAKRIRSIKAEPSQFERDLSRLDEELQNAPEVALEADQKWERPAVKPFDPAKTDIVFQQIEASEAPGESHKTVAQFFGVTEDGHSIICNVTGFMHYFYVDAPVALNNSHLAGLKANLNLTFPGEISHLELCMKENLMGYNGNKKLKYLKVVCYDPRQVSRIRGFFERGNVSYQNLFDAPCTSYDNIAYILRVMVDCGISGMSWITLPAGSYQMNAKSVSTCQIEVSIPYDKLIAHPPEGEWLKMAPLRILSFDIECAGRKGIFPEADKDPVIQIANVVSRYGETKPFIRNVFTIDTCCPIVGSQIFEYKDEASLFMKWRDFVVKSDPDIIIGYNITNFDLPYLLDRAKSLGVRNFAYFGRLPGIRQEVKDSTFSSKAYGTRESKVTNIEGRLQLDLLQFCQREYKLRSYTLNSVSAHFLNEQKEDVHPSIITDLQNGTPESRRRLAVYCLKDAFLPLRLVNKLMCLTNYTEMARVTGVPFSYLLSRGQQIKVISQMFRRARQHNLIIPNLKQEGSNDEQYEGATVIEPERGYYDCPIATLDFSSLYPSIMMAHNLCYTTLISKTTAKALNLVEGEDYTLTPNNDCFVKTKLRKGLLPIILEDLLGARKRAKADLKKETDPFKRAVLDGRQLALKISANSVYGFTGATIGKLPCLEISSSVTAYGRQMIEKTKEIVEKTYTIANGYTHDAKVVYGDTDSVMVKFGLPDLERCMNLGREAAEQVSESFLNPIKLEFEKCYFPYLLINKKRYAGLYWTNPKKYDKMDTKGIETVRRDNCQLVQFVIETVLHMILIKRDVEGAQEFVKSTISDLLQNKVDMSNLVITKQLSKSDYAGKQAHVELAERMRKRDAGSAPTLGDRVAYVITRGGKNDKNYDKSEDPLYVLEHNIPIDTKYYLDNQLSKPLQRIFEPILGEKAAQQLLSGAHTRVIHVASPSVGGMMRFAKRTALCKGCRTPLRGAYADKALCENCKPKASEYYQKQLAVVTDMETRFGRLWTQCQRCQGSLHQDVICSSKDCPIFYMRKKVQKDMEEGLNQLARFDNEW